MLNRWEPLRSYRRWSIGCLLITLASCAIMAQAQTVTIAASNINGGGGGQLLPAGTICFTPAGAPATGYQIGSTGQAGGPICRDVLIGVIQTTLNGNTLGTMTVADTALTLPANLCYNVTVRDPSGAYILGTAGTQRSGYSCVQPTANNSWCTSGACNFDLYPPNISTLPLGTTITDLTVGTLTVQTGGSAGQTSCWKDATHLSYCTSVVASDGSCTCH